MEADEEIARKLQQQFDEEAAAAESQVLLDTKLAQHIASESHQLSDLEDEDTYCSSQEISPCNEYEVISKSVEKNSSSGKHSPTKCVENSRGCSSSPSFSVAMNRSESSSKESGSNLKVDSTKNNEKNETPLSTKRKSSYAIDQKNSTSSSKSDITPNKKHGLHQPFKDLPALGAKKVSRDAATCALDEDKYKESSHRKSLDTGSPDGKLAKSPSFHVKKSSHKTESVNLKKNKSSFANSSTSDSSIVKSLSDPRSSCSKASSSDKQDNSSSNDQRPLCKYGAGCYRTNPIHLKEFKHSENSDTGVRKKEVQEADLGIKKAKSDPDLRRSNEKNIDMKLNSLFTAQKSPNKEPIVNDSRSTLKRQSSQNSSNEPLLKKKKSSESSTSTGDKSKGFAARLAASDPYRLFLTKSFSVPASHSDPLGCVLPDLLNKSLGTVVETVQFSFVVDLDFVFESYKACGLEDKPMLLLYGEMEGDTTQFTKGTFVKVSMPFLYGTHHTKLMLLLYTEGLRVVVHTANLRSDDWYEKTQGVWVSPLFPKIDVRPAPPGCPAPGDSPTLFRQDLLQYLQSYKLAPLARWADIVRRHDFAQCNAVFVGHVPGYHAGPALPFYGQLKLRRALGRHTSKDKWRGAEALNGSTTVVQCSSIGSLGKDATWLSQDLGASLSGGQCCPAAKVIVMYPSEEDVRLSSQGWMGGSCLPYQSGTHAKQPWLMKHLHHWRSDGRHRTRAMPHIKTYTRLLRSTASGPLSTSGCEAQYLLLTSANLSKAAWGQAQKQGAQLFIRSYEVGVLLLPKFVTGEESFPLSAPRSLTLPYDLPPTPYTSSDRPWLMDTNKKNEDVNGDTYP